MDGRRDSAAAAAAGASCKPLDPARTRRRPGAPGDRDRERVAQANDEARVAPTRDGYLNAIQVWPYSEGALYQVYASPGRVTDIVLQQGEELVSVSAGDTVRWIVGDTTSASGAAQRVHVLVKPMRANLQDQPRHHHQPAPLSARAHGDREDVDGVGVVELSAGSARAAEAPGAASRRSGTRCARHRRSRRLAFRYDISGDTPSWRPLRAFDDGEHVYIQFPAGIAQGELPPLFVVGYRGRRGARQLPLPRTVLHRRSPVRCRRAAPGRRQGAGRAHQPQRRRQMQVRP